MGLFNKGFSLVNRGVRYKLRIAFSLMSIIPLLVCIYLFFVYFPYVVKIPFSNLQIYLSVFVSIIIAFIGFFVAKQIVDPIIEISSEARSIAKGEYDREIQVTREDEIGDLSASLNQLTRRIRDNMEELRDYGERTKQINSEINKRVVVLSGLLQVSNLITQGAKISEIFDVSLSKLVQLKDSLWAALVTKEEGVPFKIGAQYGISDEQKIFLLSDEAKKIFDMVIFNKGGLIIDKANNQADPLAIKQILNTNNIILSPIFRHAKIVGFLGLGNSDSGADSQYNKDDLELVGIFAKQIAIAIENDYLVNRLQTLEIKDTLTGLYNKTFIINRLDEEIKRSIIYQRPCAFMLISIAKFNEFLNSFGELAGETALKKISKAIDESCSEIDRVARYGDADFAIVLPERNKKQSTEFAQDLIKKIQESFSQTEGKEKLASYVAVSENPIDGSSAKDLIKKAEEELSLTKK